MVGVCQIEIRESSASLKELMREEKSGTRKERLQVLYLLKTKKITVTEVAEMIGRNRVTVQDWLAKYRQGGLGKLLAQRVSTGRPRKVPQWAEKALTKKLEEPEGFESYYQIGEWLEKELGLVVNYKTLHQLVHYRLGASPKVGRSKSAEQQEEKLEDFKKTLHRI